MNNAQNNFYLYHFTRNVLRITKVYSFPCVSGNCEAILAKSHPKVILCEQFQHSPIWISYFRLHLYIKKKKRKKKGLDLFEITV